MSDHYHIIVLPGDGIGPEVIGSAQAVLQAVAGRFGFEVTVEERNIGGVAIDREGAPLADETLSACSSNRVDAVLLGAIGGPKWDALSGANRPEAGLLRLRAGLGVFSNLRPVRISEPLAHLSVLPRAKVVGTDLLVVRELTGGIYFGRPREKAVEYAFDTMSYSVEEIDRIAKVAFEWARQRKRKVTSVDKANVLAVSELWRERVQAIGSSEYPDVELNHLYVDNAAMQLVLNPAQFDVILTGNLFGDILSDLSSTLAGSLGLLPSASVGGSTPLFEPVHGSAPDIARKNVANPIAAVLSCAMMLDSWQENEAASAIRKAVSQTLADGYLTADLIRGADLPVSTNQFTEHLVASLSRLASPSPIS